VVLQPHERGGQAPAREDLDDPGRGRQVDVVARGHPVEALVGEQVEVGGGDPVGRVDLRGRGIEHLVGDALRTLQHPATLTAPPVPRRSRSSGRRMLGLSGH